MNKSVFLGGVAGVVGLAGMFMAGCSTTVEYGDAKAAQSLSTDFGSSDLQQIADALVINMMSFPAVLDATKDRRPVLTIDKVKNKTMQHIDTESLTDTITTKLNDTGKFRLIDRTTDAAAVEEIKIQQDSGLTDKNKATNFGKQAAPEYILTSNLTEIRQTASGVKDVYYKFTMSLKNLETGIVEWKGEKEIRKIAK
jgi:uncharacterized protein (TIGR02722 family)